jgi:hypothetical protein
MSLVLHPIVLFIIPSIVTVISLWFEPIFYAWPFYTLFLLYTFLFGPDEVSIIGQCFVFISFLTYYNMTTNLWLDLLLTFFNWILFLTMRNFYLND